jgi:hypothetical protein
LNGTLSTTEGVLMSSDNTTYPTSRSRRKPGARALALVLSLAATGALAATALAGNGAEPGTPLGSSHGLNYQVTTEPLNEEINIGPLCPVGQPPIGGGVDISGSAKRSLLEDSFPDGTGAGDPNYWRGAAINLGSSPKTLTVYGVCFKDGPSEITFVSQTVVAPIGPSEVGTAAAACPSGTKVVGGGGLLFAFGITQATVPFDDSDGNHVPDDGWRVKMLNIDDDAAILQVHAVCADFGGQRYLSEKDRINSGKAETLKVTCPSGSAAGSGGFKLKGSDVFAHASIPLDGGDGNDTPDDGWRATGVNGDGSKRKATVHAVCLS